MSAIHPTNIRAVAYYRKSSEDDGESISQQREWARGAAPREGFTVVREFEDQSKAGWNTKARTAFHEMLAFCQGEAKAGRPIDAIVCWAPDRFSRADSQETSWFIWEFRKLGTERMYSQTRGWLDFARPEQRALFGLEQDFGAHAYVINNAQNAMRGRLAAAKAGRYINGAAPLGYVLVKRPDKGVRLALASDEVVELVRWIFRRFLEPSTTLDAVARELTARGLSSPRGKPVWTGRAVKLILTNETYLGRLKWNQTAGGRFAAVVGFKVELRGRVGCDVRRAATAPADRIEADGTHEAIIDADTFDRVRRKLAQMARGPMRDKIHYPLSGLLVCGHCGRRMCGGAMRYTTTGTGEEMTYRRYSCRSYKEGRCNWNGIEADALLAALVKRLQETVFKEENLRKAIDNIRRQDAEARSAAPGRSDKLRRQLESLDVKVQKADQRFAREDDESLWPALRQRAQELRRDHTDVAAELAALERKGERDAEDLDAMAEQAIAAGLQLKEAVEAGDVDLVRELIDLAVEKVELFFTHERRGNKVRTAFAKGTIHVRDGFPFVGKKYNLTPFVLSGTITLYLSDLWP